MYEKARKVMFAINILESAWLLLFCKTVFVSWWRVYLLASSCLNWCLVEHSSVKTQRHLLVLSFFSPNPPAVTQPPPPLPLPPEYQFLVLARMFTMSSFFFAWEIQNASPSPPFSLPSGVCVKCTLPWFFFIQYSVTCLCKFGLEKNKSFYETICPGNCWMASALWVLWNGDNAVKGCQLQLLCAGVTFKVILYTLQTVLFYI